jgi:hypothetical protein
MLHEWKMQATYVHEIRNPGSKRVHHPKFTLQTSEGNLIERFCENVCKLFLGWHMYQIYVPLLHIISQKVISHLYVFGSGMKH